MNGRNDFKILEFVLLNCVTWSIFFSYLYNIYTVNGNMKINLWACIYFSFHQYVIKTLMRNSVNTTNIVYDLIFTTIIQLA